MLPIFPEIEISFLHLQHQNKVHENIYSRYASRYG